MDSTPVAIPPSQEILTLEEVLIRSEQGKQRLVAAGMSTTPKIERRLAWKRSRGIDTTVEERLCTRFKGSSQHCFAGWNVGVRRGIRP